VLVDVDVLDVTRPCVLAAQKAKHALGCIPSSVGTERGGPPSVRNSVPLSRSAEIPSRESCAQLWNPQHRTDLELLVRGQRKSQQ